MGCHQRLAAALRPSSHLHRMYRRSDACSCLIELQKPRRPLGTSSRPLPNCLMKGSARFGLNESIARTFVSVWMVLLDEWSSRKVVERWIVQAGFGKTLGSVRQLQLAGSRPYLQCKLLVCFLERVIIGIFAYSEDLAVETSVSPACSVAPPRTH